MTLFSPPPRRAPVPWWGFRCITDPVGDVLVTMLDDQDSMGYAVLAVPIGFALVVLTVGIGFIDVLTWPVQKLFERQFKRQERARQVADALRGYTVGRADFVRTVTARFSSGPNRANRPKPRMPVKVKP